MNFSAVGNRFWNYFQSANVISKNSLCLLQNGSFISQYFLTITCLAEGHSSFGKIRAVAVNSGPVTFPRIVQGATATVGLFRMRLYFQESFRVMKYSLPSRSANQSGVRTPVPFFR